ncbi:MAG: cytochrome c [Caldimonas sp.]
MTATSKHVLTTLAVTAVAAAAAFAVFIGSGAYNFAADEPHWSAVSSLLETMRERSIRTRAVGLNGPDLSDTTRILQGAGNYDAMCAGCHLAPGLAASELSQGLYPAPPNLSREKVEPGQAFWVVKHGIKGSGMPAWGKSMDDESMWNVVAFLQQLPKLDAPGYAKMVARSGGHHHDPGGDHVEDTGHDPHEAGSDMAPRAHESEHEHEHEHEHERDHEHGHGGAGLTDAAASAAASGSAHSTGADGPRVTTHTHADGSRHPHTTPGARK